MEYRVSTFREAGLEARWTRTRTGAPIIAARKPGAKAWELMDANAWRAIQRAGSVKDGFENVTLFADIFSVPA